MATELSPPIEISPSEFSEDLQKSITSTGEIFKSEVEKKDPKDLSLSELEKIGKESAETAVNNKLKIISDTVGEPVTNSDFKLNYKDMALNYDLSRNKSFVNRKDKFLSYYPEGKFIRNQVTVGNKTLNLEMYKYDKNDTGYKLVEPFGLEASDFAELMGTIVDEQLVGEGLALVGAGGALQPGNLLNRLRLGPFPIGAAAKIFLGSY